MLGKIFTEFLDLVEERFGYELVDQILLEANTTSNGAYTSIGFYSHSELFSLLEKLSCAIDIPERELLRLFGQVMFEKLIDGHPEIVSNIDNSFELLASIDNYIHVEVSKLYPNAQLPTFKVERTAGNQIILKYQSTRPMASFAQGLLLGCSEYFNEEFLIQRDPQSDVSETNVVFTINRVKKEC